VLDTEPAAASIPVRQDLLDAHARAFEGLARAGTWWTGGERIAIAEEVRRAPDCSLCTARSKALSPLAVAGEHTPGGALPGAVVEVVHQVVNDPGRLSRSWFEKVLAAGLSKEQYVETIGVIVTLVSIDSFCRGIGVPPRPLPAPEPGEPSRMRPPGAIDGAAWVPWVPENRAKGAESDLYDTPRTGNVLKALSLVPDELRRLKDLSQAHYLSPLQMLDLRAGSCLDRRQIELVAARVSALRECFY
jgi:alkylhydroperoxidase family enzyme